jgi:hypothetical protein
VLKNLKGHALWNFLEENKVQKGSEYMHTAVSKECGGSFYITPKDYDKFIDLYDDALEGGFLLNLTEKHSSIAHFVIDLDFKNKVVKNDEGKTIKLERQFTMDEMKVLCEEYTKTLSKYL